MDRKAFAVYTLLVGAGMGLLANLLFYGKLIGISFPLFIGISAIVVLASSRLTGQAIHLRNLWPIIPMMFFAIMVVVHADPLLTGLNILATMGLGALVLYYFPLKQYVDEESVVDHVEGVFATSANTLISPLVEAGDALLWLREHRPHNRGSLVAVGRGMLIATPVLLVFGVLLASADAVFAGYMNQVWRLFDFENARDTFWQLFFIGSFGWVSCGALAYGLGRRSLAHAEAAEEDAPAQPKRKPRPITLGLIESSIVLGSVDVLFGLFVLIQFAYFFGGQANIHVEALTYAQYARRGFFELVAVSVLTLGLVLWLDWVTVRHDTRQVRVFRGFAVILVALTGVMLVSAAQRMSLYEAAYGFTHLRVYTHVFMAWLGVVFVVFLLALFRVRQAVFSLGVLLVLIGYVGTLNIMNPEAYIAEHNIERFEIGSSLDIAYLYTFSVDAAPAMLRLYENSEQSEMVHEAAGQWLANALNHLDFARQNATVFSAHLARESVWRLLSAHRSEMPELMPYYRPSGSSMEGYLR